MLLLEIFEDDRSHAAHRQLTGYWGRQGAGCLFLSKKTGRILFAYRSGEVEEPHTYGTFGGAIDEGENPIDAVKREVREETLVDVQILNIIPLYVFNIPNIFTYYNFLVIVDDEFEPDIHHEDNWETEDFEWVQFGQWPRPLHPGSIKLLNDGKSIKKIQYILKKFGHGEEI